MTVKELIIKLLDCNMNSKVKIDDEYYCLVPICDVTDINGIVTFNKDFKAAEEEYEKEYNENEENN